MNINLDDALVDKIAAALKPCVIATVRDAMKQGRSDTRPYVNRREIARYLGVAESTVRKWVLLGMPVAVIDGRKFYGKQSVMQWLKAHEMPPQRTQEQKKKPVAIGVVTSSK